MIFGGAFKHSGRQGYAFAVAEGFGGFGPAVYGELMSYGRDPWVFQSTMAAALGCSIRTVQRWLSAFRERGLVQTWRAKKGEIPPGARAPIRCGWSHRSMTAWHSAGSAFRKACADLAARREARARERREGPARFRGWTAREIDREDFRRRGMADAEIEAELVRLHGPPPPD